ncbi:MAG: ORF6N domain-containing protein [Bacteroidales bacterium]|jgi:hypothetical protein|nr:ORF6N domain-containing protein [Bacteroidales bacterium]
MEIQIIEKKIFTIKEQQVILDSDVAELYGVETKRVNEAVKNNPDKFPEGYVLSISAEEWHKMKSKISTSFSSGGKVKLPKAFTEKGLYMLATILKSSVATETTIAIIETFAKVKELSNNITQLSELTDKKQQKFLMQKSGKLISDILNNDFQTVETETTLEFNLSVLKVKHTVVRKPKV